MEMTSGMLQHFIAFAPEDSAVYHVSKDGALETLYLSENIPSLLGMTREEYLDITNRDAMDLTIPADRAGLQAVTAACIRDRKPINYFYRVFHKTKGFDWVHVNAHVCAEMDSRPVILARFANMTMEGGIYMHILDASDRKVFVIDRGNYDVLYANGLACADSNGSRRTLLNRKCYDFICGKDHPCGRCSMCSTEDGYYNCDIRHDLDTGRWEEITKRGISWCGHPSLLIMIKDITRSKLSEVKAERYRRMYADATQEAKLIVWTYDTDTHSVSMLWDGYTKEVCEKYDVPQIIKNIPESLTGYIDEEDRAGFIRLYNDMDSGADHSECEFHFKLPNQAQPQYERVVAGTMLDDTGKKRSVYCIGQNITSQKLAQLEYDNMRKQLINNLADVAGSFQLNLTKNLYISGYSCFPGVVAALERRTADEHFAATAQTIVDDRIKKSVLRDYTCANLLKLFGDGQKELACDYPVRTSRGGIMWIHSIMHIMRNPSTGDIEGITYSKDITVQKRNAEIIRLAVSENCEYVGIIDIVAGTYERHSGTWILSDARGQVFPYGSIRADVASLLLTEDVVKDVLKRTDIPAVIEGLSYAPRYIVSYHCTNADDNRYQTKQISFCWLNDAHREILVTQQDVTATYEQEQKNNQQLRQAMLMAEHANDMKTEFLSNLSHDMRTPLNAVLGYTGFAMQSDNPEEIKDYLRKIAKSGNLLLTLINDTLDLSKIESGKITLKPEIIGCGEAISRVVASIRPEAEKKNIRFVIDNSRAVMATINIDVLRVQEIFNNLLSNAVKFTSSGGTITLIIECVKLEKNCVHDRITVRDTGCGISPDFLPRIFEPFTQERTAENAGIGGSGLGLSIVKRLINLMGGTIEVSSTLGKGTDFVVCLDFERVDDSLQEKSRQSAGTLSLDGLHLLLCEDNAMNREIAVKLLEFRGVSADIAINGREGLTLFANSKPGTYDAVIMDVRMPVMDGIDATKAIRSLTREDAEKIPIIAMTADAFDDDVQKCTDAGMNAHISKPIDPETLYGTIAAEVNRAKNQQKR